MWAPKPVSLSPWVARLPHHPLCSALSLNPSPGRCHLTRGLQASKQLLRMVRETDMQTVAHNACSVSMCRSIYLALHAPWPPPF